MKQFLKNPEECTHSECPIVHRLIYGWGNEGWSASAEYVAACIDHSLRSRGAILECGSGLTTILIAAIASKRGLSHWALEHAPEWVTRVQTALNKYKFESVFLCSAPLYDYGDYCWYDIPLDSMPRSFSLVICDGPPGNSKGGRYGLVPIMKKRLEPGCIILLDDAGREQELTILRRWEAELNASKVFCGYKSPYVELKVNYVDRTKNGS
jgi:hypothetical protein